MADSKHCFGCRKSVYVDNVRKEHIPFSGKVCLYCFECHKYKPKRELADPRCFEPEDKRNPSPLMEKDVIIDRAKFGKLTNTLR